MVREILSFCLKISKYVCEIVRPECSLFLTITMCCECLNDKNSCSDKTGCCTKRLNILAEKKYVVW